MIQKEYKHKMRTGDYRRFFDNLGILYPTGTSKEVLEMAYRNYWKYNSLGENNIYHRLPTEVKRYISSFIKTPGLRKKVVALHENAIKSYDGTFTFTVELQKLYNLKKTLGHEEIVLKAVKKIALRKTLKSFLH